MRKLFIFLALAIFVSSTSYAGIPVGPDNYTGSRSTPDTAGIDSTGGYLQQNGGFKIEWDISFDEDTGFWDYKYTLTDADGSTVNPDVSHWILQISEEIPIDRISDFIFDSNAQIQTRGPNWPKDPDFPNNASPGGNFGNPNLGTNLYGIKFNTSSAQVDGVYTFKSVEPPVWGDFYIK